MSPTWRADTPVPPRPIRWEGRVTAMLRAVPILLLLAVGLGLLLALRLFERPLYHPRRPWTPWITVGVCRGVLLLLGLRVRRRGAPLGAAGAWVANHSSWLDILALNAVAPVVFVAKSEVAGWAGIGWLARATGTVFVRRDLRGEAAAQVAEIAGRIGRGETVVLFPEGTSTDGHRVLPFKSALLAAPLAAGAAVQPVTLAWVAPEGEDPRFYGWFGSMDFGPHALSVLATRRQGAVTITFHEAIPVGTRDRKSLAAEAEAVIRGALGEGGRE